MKNGFLKGLSFGFLLAVLFSGVMLTHAQDNKEVKETKDTKNTKEKTTTDKTSKTDAATASAKPKFAPTNYKPIRSIEDIEADVPLESEDANVKIVYKTPESCKEFTLYLDDMAERLRRRERKLIQDQKMVEMMKKDLEKLTTNFLDTEQRIKKIVQHDPTNLKDNPELTKMIHLYETFTPEEAAARLRNLDLDLTLAILKGMKPKVLSKILTAMEPQLSAALSSRIVRGF